MTIRSKSEGRKSSSDMSGAPREFRDPIYDNILDTIGARPIVRMMGPANVESKFLEKLELLNTWNRSKIASASK